MCLIMCSGFYSYYLVCLVYFILLLFVAFFSLTRSDISAGNSLSVHQYTAEPLSYIDACFFCVFAVYWK